MNLREVTFLLMRHPKHKNDVVTPEGEAKIKAAAQELLPQFGPIHHIMSTETNRAKQTVKVALAALGQPCRPELIIEDPSLGFDYLEDWINKKYPCDDALDDRIEAEQTAGRPVTVQRMCEEFWPPAMIIRHTLRVSLRHWAEKLVSLRNSDHTVLVGNHDSNVYATLTPKETDGCPPYCSIAVYKYEIKLVRAAFAYNSATLVSSDLLIPSNPIYG